MRMIYLVAAIIVVLFLLSFLDNRLAFKVNRKNKRYIRYKIAKMDKDMKNLQNMQYNILELDKLIFFVLKAKGYKGDTTYSLIKDMKQRGENKDFVGVMKKINRIRRSIVNELDFILPPEIGIELYKNVKPFLISSSL